MSTYPKQLEPNAEFKNTERWQLAENETLEGVHQKSVCEPPCPLHYPSEHAMDNFPLHWRGDRGIFERICEHGVGHPDPDTIDHIANTRGGRQAESESVHGCDGCCSQLPLSETLESSDVFEMTDGEMKNIFMATVLGAGPDGMEEDEIVRIASNFVNDVKLARLTITLHDLMQAGEIVLLPDEDNQDGWKVMNSTAAK